MARARLQQIVLWTSSALLLLGAAGTAGYTELRRRAVGAALAAGGSDASGETWRRAQGDPEALDAYQAMRREEREWALEEQQTQRRLRLGAVGLAIAGAFVALGARWHRRRSSAS